MTRYEARNILNAVRGGQSFGITEHDITLALMTLGDLPNPLQNVAQSAPWRTPRNESNFANRSDSR